MPYEIYLAHHGTKGQKWGVRHGPPYPLRRVTTRASVDDQNSIYKTLSLDDKKKLMGIDKNSKEKPPRKFTNEEQLSSEDYIRSYVTRYKDVPISAFGIWNEGDGNVAISVMTRGEEEYRGKGFASDAAKKGMEWIDNNSKIKTVYWDVRIDNIGSIALAEKYGFERMKGKSPNPEWTAYWKRYNRE